mmetsp:Transcript_16228/g.61841  ORF Transcript_16228/g.61841 Transcript_16228/m.61841 type:complete len:293 (-) Transcript_16228:1710-2588(-)
MMPYVPSARPSSVAMPLRRPRVLEADDVEDFDSSVESFDSQDSCAGPFGSDRGSLDVDALENEGGPATVELGGDTDTEGSLSPAEDPRVVQLEDISELSDGIPSSPRKSSFPPDSFRTPPIRPLRTPGAPARARDAQRHFDLDMRPLSLDSELDLRRRLSLPQVERGRPLARSLCRARREVCRSRVAEGSLGTPSVTRRGQVRPIRMPAKRPREPFEGDVSGVPEPPRIRPLANFDVPQGPSRFDAVVIPRLGERLARSALHGVLRPIARRPHTRDGADGAGESRGSESERS